jgi:ribonucleoside-diphosphate reductase alpha chain
LTFKTKYEEDLFYKRYARAGTEKCWDDVFRRVADYVTEDKARQEEYFYMMSEGYFLPSSPQLWNFGVPGETAGSSCFVYDIDDTLESIWKADETARDVYKASGGIGFNLSKLRPRGAKIGNSPNPSVGVLSVAERLNLTTRYITAGGRSRGALMLQLDCDHPDIIEFILAKRPIRRNPGQEPAEWDLPLTQCNMSVRCSDGFMKSIGAGQDWPLYWTNEDSATDNPFQELAVTTWGEYREIWKQTLNEHSDPQSAFFYHKVLMPAIKDFEGPIMAHQIWEMIIDNAWNHADPGVVFSDEYERRNTTPARGKMLSNPCSEFIAPPKDACNLGSLNLPKIFTEKDKWHALEHYTKSAVRYLNNALDVNSIPVKEIEEGNKATRRIGLGVMGLADQLLLSGFGYSEEAARRWATALMGTIEATAWEESYRIAKEDPSKQSEAVSRESLMSLFQRYAQLANDLRLPELRGRFEELLDEAEHGDVFPANASVTSIAPTGTIAQIAGFIKGHQGVSSGIEPVFSWNYHREDHNGQVKIQHWTAEAAEKQGYTHEVANNISAESHIRMLAAVVQFVSMSASKTINLPESATREDVSSAYKLAWELSIPGTTVYRNNSKPFQVLSSEPQSGSVSTPVSKVDTVPLQNTESRPDRLQGFTEKVPVVLGNGLQKNIYITINHTEDHPYEVFFYGLNRDELQDPIARELGTVGRLVSMAMRYHVPVEEIIDQLEKIDGQHLFSLPTKLSKLLSAFVAKDEEGNARLHCKQCGEVTPHQMTDGCKTCCRCGLSAC